MKRKITNLLLPIVAVAMVLGTSGMKEVGSALFADQEASCYQTCDNKSDYEVKNILKNADTSHVFTPNFTFLVPGFGTVEGAWSNSLVYTPNDDLMFLDCLSGSKEFCYNPDSVLTKIEQVTDANIYVLKCGPTDNYEYHLYYYEHSSGANSYLPRREVASIYNVDQDGKHSVIVYSSNNSKQAMDGELANFERIVNRIVYDYSFRHHYVPKINLIGHSMGGLIAQEYANKYPNIVYSINTIASPFFGSDTGRFLQRISDYPVTGWFYNLLGSSFLDYPAFSDFQNIERSNQRRTTWNQVRKSNKVYANAYGSVLTLPYIRELVETIADASNLPLLNALLTPAVIPLATALDTINNNNTSVPFDSNFEKPISYSVFENDCTPINVEEAKILLKAGLHPIFDMLVGTSLGAVVIPILELAFPGIGTAIAGLASTPLLISNEFALDDLAGTIAKGIVCYKNQICVLRDDFLVGLDSQMCTGYTGYHRYVTVFNEDYLARTNTFYATDPMPLVGHNLETMNRGIVSSLVERGQFGTKEDTYAAAYENHNYQTMTREGHVDYVLNQDDLEYHNGHGQPWAEFVAFVEVNDVDPSEWNTIWVTCYDNHSTAEFFDASIAHFYDNIIKLVLYVHEADYEATGYITINYTYVSELRLDHIEVDGPSKTTFYSGETITFDDLVVVAHYTSGATKILEESQYALSYDDATINTLGSHLVTVTYIEDFTELGNTFTIEKTDTFIITIRTPQMTSVAVDTSNCQTEFETGDNFNYNGLAVYAIYEDGNVVQKNTFYLDATSVNMNVAGVYPVYVTCADNYITKTTSYDITVEYVALESITLSGNPQTTFEVGDEFNYDGLVVTANYSNGRTVVVDDYVVGHRGLDMSTAGTYTITVSFTSKGVTKKATYQITVVYNGPSLTGITLSGDYQTSFQVGEQFNHDGLVVTAHYSDGTSRVVSGYSVMPLSYNPNRPGTYNVIVNYSDNGGFALTSYSVTVEFLLIPVFLESITLSGNYRTEYRMGQALDFTGLIVTANYTDGSSEEITDYVIDTSAVNMLFPGYYDVRVLYTFKGTTAVAVFTIHIGRFIKDPDLPPLPDDPIKPFPGGKF